MTPTIAHIAWHVPNLQAISILTRGEHILLRVADRQYEFVARSDDDEMVFFCFDATIPPILVPLMPEPLPVVFHATPRSNADAAVWGC